ncbi:tautomerase family protein [Mycobacterium sp. BMJ-28]
MPVYECLTAEGSLDAEQRRVFAEQVTAIHTEETGAPADFVHVVFPELSAEHMYSSGKAASPSIIRGQIRAGRPQELRERLITRIFQAYTSLTGAAPMAVVVAVLDVPAQWAMEDGRILPEPTEEAEAAWFGGIVHSTPPDA